MIRYVLFLMLLVTGPGLLALDLLSPLANSTETSGFGMRSDYMGGATERFHGGIDLAAPIGTPVHAAAGGWVVRVWPPPGTPAPGGGVYRGHPLYGGCIRIQHEDGSFALYGHLSRVDVWEGWHVWAGRQIGAVGSTGISTGPHLHFEHLVAPQFTPKFEPDTMDALMAAMARRYLARDLEERGIPR